MSVPAGGDLRRVIGFWGGTALIVGITIGSGIFRKPYSLAQGIHDPWIILALWTGFGLISIFGALAVAELASMMPQTGGVYVYLRAAYGDSSAFVFGWIYLLVATPAVIGALATFFGELFVGLFPRIPTTQIPVIAAATLVILAAANLVGARMGAAIGGLFTAIKTGALLMLMAVCFFVADGSTQNLAIRSGAHFDIASLGMGAASVIFAYDGWNAVSMIAGEVVAAEKLMKRIIIAGMLVITVLYVGANIGYFVAMPLPEMAGASEGVPQRIMTKAFGPAGGTIIGAAILCSVFGALNGNVIAKPRVPYALAQDGLTFAFLGRSHPRFGTPYMAILIQTGVAILMVFLLRDPRNPGELFDKLTTYFVVVEWSALLFTVAAVFVLRRKLPDLPRPFRTPGYPAVPILFLAGAGLGVGAIIWGQISKNDWSGVWGLLISLVGYPVYYIWRRKRTRITESKI
jgi:basic amino acid/polyamine antiporter, APA family